MSNKGPRSTFNKGAFWFELLIIYPIPIALTLVFWRYHVVFPLNDQNSLYGILTSLITVSSILFAFSGVVLTTLATVYNSPVVRELADSKIIGHVFIFLGEVIFFSLVVVFISISGFMGVLHKSWCIHYVLIFSFFAAIIKFSYSILLLIILLWKLIHGKDGSK